MDEPQGELNESDRNAQLLRALAMVSALAALTPTNEGEPCPKEDDE